MLFLDGVYVERPDGSLRFRWVKAPTSAELTRLAQTLALRVGRLLERQGLLERDVDDCMDAGDRAPRVGALGDIDIETCRECGGAVRIIACIDDPVVIEKILTHLQEKLTPAPAGLRQAGRHRSTCLADTINLVTPIPMALTLNAEPGCRLA